MNIRLAAGTTLTSVEGTDVLFSVRTGESYGLNETAAQMIRLSLQGGVGQAATQMAAEYGVNADDIRGDIVQLIQELVQLRMVEPAADHGA